MFKMRGRWLLNEITAKAVASGGDRPGLAGLFLAARKR
jgi:hypothetical protein